MIKRLAFSLLCLWTISANAFTNKNLDTMCNPATETGLACHAYVIGITQAWKAMSLLTEPECKKFKILSPGMVLAAFQAEYQYLNPEKEAIVFLSKYIIKNGGCLEDG